MSTNSSQLDCSLPSVLMPLVSQYLNYEEVTVCMRLNSDFRNLIDTNWKDMPKKVIWIKLMFSYGSKKALSVSFDDSCIVDNKNEYAMDFYNGDPAYVDIHDSEIVLHEDYQTTFMQEYIMKNCAAASDVDVREYELGREFVYATESIQGGLKLVLDALSLRFSIGLILLKSSARHMFEAASDETVVLQYISQCLSCHYKPRHGHMVVHVSCFQYSPSFVEFAKSLGTERNYMLLHGYGEPFDLLQLDTSVQYHLLWREPAQLELSGLLTEWKDGQRQIQAVAIRLDESFDMQDDAVVHSFRQVFQVLQFETKEEFDDDGWRKNVMFELMRNDRKVLRVHVYEGFSCSSVFIHEHQPNCDCYEMFKRLDDDPDY